ncbi:hypothetical protein QE411_003131 [Microbacterium arborescens]|nr:hypothetical protein [Microbacterium arborescens]
MLPPAPTVAELDDIPGSAQPRGFLPSSSWHGSE